MRDSPRSVSIGHNLKENVLAVGQLHQHFAEVTSHQTGVFLDWCPEALNELVKFGNEAEVGGKLQNSPRKRCRRVNKGVAPVKRRGEGTKHVEGEFIHLRYVDFPPQEIAVYVDV